jgi:pyruvate,water dikinase
VRGLPGAEPTLPAHAVYSLDWFHPTAGESGGWSAETADAIGAAGSSRLAASRLATEAACRTALGPNGKLRSRFDTLLDVAQRYAVIREEQARDLTLGWPLLRRCARRLGELSREAGAIDEVDEIFFLPLAAFTSGEDARDAARLGRAEWDRHRKLVAPLSLGRAPRLIGDPIARAVESARAGHNPAEGAIVGHPASAGRATGRVRIITDPADFDSFLQGEVLVTRATAPAWTPLFARAAAVVTDGGTLAAHASLVAREYGIPAVVGTGVATTQLRTGQLVTVDGGAGTVLPVSADVVVEG